MAYVVQEGAADSRRLVSVCGATLPSHSLARSAAVAKSVRVSRASTPSPPPISANEAKPRRMIIHMHDRNIVGMPFSITDHLSKRVRKLGRITRNPTAI